MTIGSWSGCLLKNISCEAIYCSSGREFNTQGSTKVVSQSFEVVEYNTEVL